MLPYKVIVTYGDKAVVAARVMNRRMALIIEGYLRGLSDENEVLIVMEGKGEEDPAEDYDVFCLDEDVLLDPEEVEAEDHTRDGNG